MKLHFWRSPMMITKSNGLFLCPILSIYCMWFSQIWLPIREILFPSDFPNTKPQILNLFICVVYFIFLGWSSNFTTRRSWGRRVKKKGLLRAKSSQKVIQRKELETHNFHLHISKLCFLPWRVKELRQKSVYQAAEIGNVLSSMKRRKSACYLSPIYQRMLICF